MSKYLTLSLAESKGVILSDVRFPPIEAGYNSNLEDDYVSAYLFSILKQITFLLRISSIANRYN